MLSFHGSRDKTEFDFVGYNSRLDELQAVVPAAVPDADRRLERGPARSRGAVRRARPRRPRRAAAGRARAHLPPVRLPLAGARPHPRRAHGGGNRVRDLLHDAAAPAAGAALPRLRARLAARDGARRTGELLRPALAGHPGRGAGAGGRRRPLRGRRRRPRMSGIGRHRLLQLLADAAIVAVSWVLAFEIRFDHGLPVYYDTLLRRTILIVVAIKLAVFIMFGFHRRWWRYVSVRDMWSAARGVVVASPRRRRDRLLRLAGARSAPAALDRGDGPADHARARRRRPPVRAHRDGTAALRRRRPRQGSGRRRSRRRGPARRAGDAALAADRVHAHRLRRRRPAQAQHAHPRRARPRHDGGPAADRARVLARRGADRDPVGLGRDPPPRRRGGPGVQRAGEDAAGAVRAHLRRRQPRRPVPARPGRGRARARAGRGGLRAGLLLSPGAHRARHRGGRLDRLRALPPDRARRRGAADPRRQRGDAAVRHRARARGRARLHRRPCRS